VAAARAMLRGVPRALDFGAVDRPDGTHYFAVACGAGFDAEVMAQTAMAAKQRWKIAAYMARGLEMLRTVTSVRHRVTVDGASCELQAATVLIANCGELVPAVLRLKHARPDDGWFDVLALRVEGLADSLGTFWDLVTGPAPGSERAWSARGRTVRVEVLEGPPRPVQLDGEEGGETPFEARLLPGALIVLAAPVTARQSRRTG
jgi:diacylglycerol kinase family enzyme